MPDSSEKAVPSVPQKNETSAKLLLDYFDHEVSGATPGTVEAKRRDLEKFCQFLLRTYGDVSFTDWTPAETKLFLLDLERAGVAPATRNRALATLRTFGRWLQDKGCLTSHPCRGVRDLHLELPPPKAPRDLEFNRLRRAASNLSGRSFEDERNFVLFELLAASGLRISEVLGLKARQLQGKRLVRILCKGGRVRDLLINAEVASSLTDFVQKYRIQSEDFIFQTAAGLPLDRRNAARALDKIAALANVKLPENEHINLSPHRLRHYHAFKCRLAKDPVFAAKRLGHASLQYIGRYSTETEREEAEIIEKI